jgi:hypothetical protein
MGLFDTIGKVANGIGQVANGVGAARQIYHNMPKPVRRFGKQLFRTGAEKVGGLADAFRNKYNNYRSRGNNDY